MNAAQEEARRKSVIDIQHQAKLEAQDAEAESKTGEDEVDNEESVSAVSGITPTSEHNLEESKVGRVGDGLVAEKKKPLDIKPVMKMVRAASSVKNLEVQNQKSTGE